MRKTMWPEQWFSELCPQNGHSLFIEQSHLPAAQGSYALYALPMPNAAFTVIASEAKQSRAKSVTPQWIATAATAATAASR
jgi:hypothetical protein